MGCYGKQVRLSLNDIVYSLSSRLSTYCKRSTGSVPRNRVFAQYADRCGSERVPPLNPASFGKLVRIIFPGISTRRLGVRGESKYHYVELVLSSRDLPELSNIQRSPSVNLDNYSTQHTTEGNNLQGYVDNTISLATRAKGLYRVMVFSITNEFLSYSCATLLITFVFLARDHNYLQIQLCFLPQAVHQWKP